MFFASPFGRGTPVLLQHRRKYPYAERFPESTSRPARAVRLQCVPSASASQWLLTTHRLFLERRSLLPGLDVDPACPAGSRLSPRSSRCPSSSHGASDGFAAT